jgi:hypothetical protein
MTGILATLLQLILSLLLMVQNSPSISDVQKQQIVLFANQAVTAATQMVAQPTNPTTPIACTMEAKLCADGKTYVSHTGPNCEFSACPISTITGQPIIDSLSIYSGSIDAQVTINGLGFTVTGNQIKFGDLGVEDSPSYSLNSPDGRTIVFTVPETNYYPCQSLKPSCYMPNYLILAGTYPVSVINANGISNTLNFTVTSNSNETLLCPAGTVLVGSTNSIPPHPICQ